MNDSSIDGITVVLQPLHKLQIVKRPSFHELVHFHMLSDLELVEDVLKDLVVLDHLVLALGVEIDLVHRHHPGVDRVHELALHGAGARLFDFGEVEVEGGVDPGEDLGSTDEVGRVHHPDVRRHCWILLSFFVFFLWFAQRERERERFAAPIQSPANRRAGGEGVMAAYRWKSFEEDEDRPEKPRRYGVTEIRGPHYSFFNQNLLQDIFESMAPFVDGLKFSGGSHSLMPKSFIKEITDIAHEHNVYVSTGDWAEHLLRQGPSAFKEYVQECKQLGFDTVELNVGTLEIPEDTLLRFVRTVKSDGLKVKPLFAVKFNKSDIPKAGDRAFGAYVVPEPRSSEFVEDVDLLIRRAERCLEAGADMIMIDPDDICNADAVRADLIAKIVGRLGLEKTMFEASNARTSEWFIQRYGPKVNLFVDHSQVMDLECLRGRKLGKNHSSVLGSSYFLF